jgi:Cu(I)/Ag(I) efflux system membrane protein CusA/SilA
MQLEKHLKDVPSIEPAAVFADRIVGKPYLEIVIDRDAIARYGLSIQKVQGIISIAIGGMGVTSTVEGRERYKIRVRYPREQRGLGGGIDDLKKIIIPVKSGMKMGGGMNMGSGMDMGSSGRSGSTMQIPLGQLAKIEFRQGPQMIKSEDTFLTGYVLFDKKPGYAEVDVVVAAREHIQHKIDLGELVIPEGVNYHFAGSYESQERFVKRLRLILPIALFLIFLILYFQFKNVLTTFLVFAGIVVAWSGGFLLIWFYGQEWFLNVNFLGVNLRDLFQIHQINLSVAIWVGFLALFGIASDNGVVICTYLDQRFAGTTPASIDEVRRLTIEAATRRVRPALMTSATTILALLPVLTSTGRGADVMVPMAIPSFGGMMIQLLTIFMAPILYSIIKEVQFKGEMKKK